MITQVVLPKFTKTMTQGVIRTWKVEEGQGVVPGDVLAEIETDTAVMELEAAGSGFLRHILIAEGSAVKAGTIVAVIGDLDDNTGPTVKEAMRLQKLAQNDQDSSRPATYAKSKTPRGKEELVSTRKARTARLPESSPTSLEEEALIVESVEIIGSSPQSSTTRRVEQKPQNGVLEPTVTVAEETLEVIGDLLEDARESVDEFQDELVETPTQDSNGPPQFTLTTEISMADGERLRGQMIEIQQTTLSLTTLYVRAAALACSRLPEFQAACFGDEKGSIDIGMAITVEDRLLTPVIRDCGRKNIAELSDEIQEATRQARMDQCLSDEDSDAFFSIVHLGMYPIERFTPILRSTQAAALAIGAVRNVKTSEEEMATLDSRTTVSLTCNDECLDEDQAAKFLGTFKQILERPLEIFLPNPVE